MFIGVALNPINSSMIATGLVGIGVDFHSGPGTTASLISVLYLCSAVMQPTMGKLSTLFGPRRVFLAGILILLAGGVVGTLAPAFGFLLLSRALIGIEEIAAFRKGRSPANLARVIVRQQVVTFGTDFASVTVEFERNVDGKRIQGRQSQVWVRLPEGWRIVSAHVSILQ